MSEAKVSPANPSISGLSEVLEWASSLIADAGTTRKRGTPGTEGTARYPSSRVRARARASRPASPPREGAALAQSAHLCDNPPTMGRFRRTVRTGAPTSVPELKRRHAYIDGYDAAGDMRLDFCSRRASGIYPTLEQVRKKFAPKIGRGLAMKELESISRLQGWARLRLEASHRFRQKQDYVRKELAVSTASAARKAEQYRGKEIMEHAAKAAAQAEAEARERHIRRVSDELDRSFEEGVSKMPVKPNTVSHHLDALDRFEKIGRRIFNLDDAKPLDARTFNISVLVAGPEALEAAPAPPVIEAETTPV